MAAEWKFKQKTWSQNHDWKVLKSHSGKKKHKCATKEDIASLNIGETCRDKKQVEKKKKKEKNIIKWILAMITIKLK